MQALVYRVTKHAIPGWVPFHEKASGFKSDLHPNRASFKRNFESKTRKYSFSRPF